ncbi:sigma-54-dependent transcriptional regulator [Desulfomicrobium baculatum]|uniref:Putative two component, sigma54 specific, transcriptional regulator, Fis family n=1 Tax=Desulfomicrobium baculatum (strain DSM 4028 / VKM B-1378 / X) TaxID=525897 RepID=C7LSB8_DESBD|nr:sigma-54 dependent transcriptional regulator [Desulfomicrobium baculatum]ACU90666.1 putative two component, sigma54 specific, transcriptional regulator, Fis family [Desulfomicrobium baculatum DSM 4028]
MGSVLIIHERSDICHMLSPAIESHGHECFSLASCADAVHVLKSNAFDIAILDIDITENPAEAVAALAKSECRPHILVITNGCNPVILEEAIRAGAWDVICAPFTQDELGQAINRCLHHRRARMGIKSHGDIKRDAIIGTSPCLEHCLDHIATAANSNVNILILGETGTGKELFANAIHENSTRATNSFIVVDCTNIPRTLAESLLFGHERGSFTGAAESRDGLFRQADGGTIFLDEIGDLDLDVQKSLLRVLQERRFRPLSSKKEVASNFRLVAATNRNLEGMVKRGEFRKDLYHRLCTNVIQLPPLRERKEDILPIASYHVRQICAELGCEEKEISYELHHALTLYDWPGNVRELINVLHATAQNGTGECRLYPQHLPVDIRARVMLKRSGRPQTGGYLVVPEVCDCTSGDGSFPCPLLPQAAASACRTPGFASTHPHLPARDVAQPGPSADSGLAAPPQERPTPKGLVGSPTEHKPGNGFAHIEGPYITLPLAPENAINAQLLPLRTVRELAMQEVEAAYLKRLVASSQGNFQRALTISGLSRARLYDLLSKHSMSISGN